MHSPLNDQALDQLFREARTYYAFSGEVSDDTLRQVFDLMKLGPTGANQCPARWRFVRTPEAKAQLVTAVSASNAPKVMSAPVTAIVAFDLDFHDHLPRLFPHANAKAWFEGDAAAREQSARLNAALQAAYFMLAARAVGLDCGPMSGFDPAKTDSLFLADQPRWRSFMLINLGVGDAASLFERLPRFDFDDIARIV
ncbi:malonic semialdehyde reductase [Comamonas serinivorans]|uniref:Malonic semialdehyde reductase n=1 Tax=Comamonas serinivorans TaxID=1082851 RepID=A0A1Y0ERL1_9BURK|nr:malonic semialdehyde reductase [Comamonas serinivorans]ARU06216.1 malonic semialdehyde reductase [Comamonas serinivorans]